jgi:hypothetical protein
MAKNMAEIGKEKKMFFGQFHPKKPPEKRVKKKGCPKDSLTLSRKPGGQKKKKNFSH